MTLLATAKRKGAGIGAAALSSTVPPLVTTFVNVCRSYFNVEPLVVGTGVRTGAAGDVVVRRCRSLLSLVGDVEVDELELDALGSTGEVRCHGLVERGEERHAVHILSQLRILEDAAHVSAAAADRIVQAAIEAVAARGVFHLCTTGGSTPSALYRALREPARAARMPWAQTQIWFGDDRFVPRTDPLSNLAPLDAHLLAASADGTPSPLSPSAVHPWPTARPTM